jgi:hypothetical protein
VLEESAVLAPLRAPGEFAPASYELAGRGSLEAWAGVEPRHWRRRCDLDIGAERTEPVDE